MVFLSSIPLVGLGSTEYTHAQGQPSNQFPESIIAFSDTDNTPHALKLSAIQQGNGEPQEVSGFSLDTTNTLTSQLNSQLLVFVTDSSVQVVEAKVKTESDQLINLVPSTQANAFSLANLPAGVYTLDVITQKGNTKAAYEGILVLGQTPTNPQTIIERENEDDDTVIVFRDGDAPPPNGGAVDAPVDAPPPDAPDVVDADFPDVVVDAPPDDAPPDDAPPDDAPPDDAPDSSDASDDDSSDASDEEP
jgi:hypothetical protein